MSLIEAAAVQAAPVLFDTPKTLSRLAELARDAAGKGAERVVLPEAFVGGTGLAGPDFTGETIQVAELDRRLIAQGKDDLDVAGHHARPDVVSLSAGARPKPAVAFTRLPKLTIFDDAAEEGEAQGGKTCSD